MFRSWLLLVLPACSFHVHTVDVTLNDLSASVDLSSEDLTEAADLTESADLNAPDLSILGDLAITPQLKVTKDNAGDVNLTNEGTRDWMHFGLVNQSDVNRKDFVTAAIAETTTGSLNSYNLFNPNLSWNDGTPTGSATNTNKGVYVFAVNNGYSFTVATSSTKQTLRLYLGEYRGTGTLVAHLSDGSVADATTNDTDNGGVRMSRFTIEFRTPGPATLTVTWKLTNDNGGGAVDLMAATLF